MTYSVENDTVKINITVGRKGDLSDEMPVDLTIVPQRMNDSPDAQMPVELELMFEKGLLFLPSSLASILS